ncbi:MAG: hypothetical protein LBV52_03805 [Spirochaetaceae bacterium]|jgi:hypothetical protein|nr:hypothetical protein [Spirochaetaceae bacterium]
MRKNNVIRAICVCIFAACLSAGIVGCNKNDPKNLAKQYVELLEEVAAIGSDPAKILAIQAKIATLEEKRDKLSEQGQQIFEAEVERLSDFD